jgi:hypothetical protein
MIDAPKTATAPPTPTRGPAPPGCKLVTPNPYDAKSTPEAGARFKEQNDTMYEDADGVFVGFDGNARKDILFP